MANLTKSLVMPNGQEYEFVGKHWYGVNVSRSSNTYNVSITGFNGNDLVDGTQVTVQFAYAQDYNGSPYLNISSTGSRLIYRDAGNLAGQYEWGVYSVVTFVLRNGVWIIIDGGHAGTTYFGKTKLSNSIANDQTVALTPKAVYDAGYVNASGAAAAAPVQSVNGQTGAVSLTIPTVPTNVSAFNNDAGYITSAALPTNVSDLTNDSGYLTLATLPIWDGGVI